jgi:hypothetical protein
MTPRLGTAFRLDKRCRTISVSVLVELEGQRIKPYVLADSAYPGGEDVLKPFLYSRANDTDKRRFNLRHCRSRRVVEQAFGMLKCR